MALKLGNAKTFYDAGHEAKKRGFARVTPYYGQPRGDYWWLAGFDGVDFFEAEAKQPEFPVKVMSPDRARSAGLPVPKDVDQVHIHGGTVNVG